MLFRLTIHSVIAVLVAVTILAKPVSRFSTQPLDLNVEKLPINYAGHSLPSLVGAIKSRQSLFNKSQYETTEQYNERYNRLKAQPLIGSLTLDTPFAFSLDSSEATYDADRQLLFVKFKSYEDGLLVDELNVDISPNYFAQWLWSFSEVNQGAFTARNAFGVRWRARAYKQTQAVLLAPAKEGRAHYAFDVEDVTVVVAKKYKQSLKLLFIGKAANPYIAASSDVDNASLDNPHQVETFTYGLYFHPSEYWLYDYTTGDILSKQKINQEKSK